MMTMEENQVTALNLEVRREELAKMFLKDPGRMRGTDFDRLVALETLDVLRRYMVMTAENLVMTRKLMAEANKSRIIAP